MILSWGSITNKSFSSFGKLPDFFISNKFLVVSIFILISYYSLVIPNSNDENEKFHIPKTLKIHGQFIGLDNDSRIRIKVLNQVKNDTITLLFDPIAEIQIKKNWIELNEGETIWFDLWEHDSELYNRDSRIKTQFRAYSLHKNDKTIFSIEDYSKMVKLSVNIVDPQQKLKNFLFAIFSRFDMYFQFSVFLLNCLRNTLTLCK